MVEIRDGDELTVYLPEGGGICFVVAPPLGDPPAASACGSMNAAAISPSDPLAPGERLVTAGAVRLEGVPTPVRFAVRFAPDPAATEPTAEIARDFGEHEVTRHTPHAVDHGESGRSDAAAIDIVAVGGLPTQGAPTSELVTLGGLHAARAAFAMDLRQAGHDVPVHLVSYGAWARNGLYTLTVDGDEFHAPAIDAFADEAVRTLWLRDPAPAAPSDLVQIGTKLGQIGLVLAIVVAVTLAVLATRTRRLRD